MSVNGHSMSMSWSEVSELSFEAICQYWLWTRISQGGVKGNLMFIISLPKKFHPYILFGVFQVKVNYLNLKYKTCDLQFEQAV